MKGSSEGSLLKVLEPSVMEARGPLREERSLLGSAVSYAVMLLIVLGLALQQDARSRIIPVGKLETPDVYFHDGFVCLQEVAEEGGYQVAIAADGSGYDFDRGWVYDCSGREQACFVFADLGLAIIEDTEVGYSIFGLMP